METKRKKRIFVLMKKCLIITSLAVYLFSTTELHELLKIPVLIEHFLEHKEENHQLSLLDFLHDHYAHQDSTDDDSEHQLPFKSHPESFYMTSFIAILPEFPIAEPKMVFEEAKKFDLKRIQFTPNHNLTAIWQPPKQA